MQGGPSAQAWFSDWVGFKVKFQASSAFWFQPSLGSMFLAGQQFHLEKSASCENSGTCVRPFSVSFRELGGESPSAMWQVYSQIMASSLAQQLFLVSTFAFFQSLTLESAFYLKRQGLLRVIHSFSKSRLTHCAEIFCAAAPSQTHSSK